MTTIQRSLMSVTGRRFASGGGGGGGGGVIDCGCMDRKLLRLIGNALALLGNTVGVYAGVSDDAATRGDGSTKGGGDGSTKGGGDGSTNGGGEGSTKRGGDGSTNGGASSGKGRASLVCVNMT